MCTAYLIKRLQNHQIILEQAQKAKNRLVLSLIDSFTVTRTNFDFEFPISQPFQGDPKLTETCHARQHIRMNNGPLTRTLSAPKQTASFKISKQVSIPAHQTNARCKGLFWKTGSSKIICCLEFCKEAFGTLQSSWLFLFAFFGSEIDRLVGRYLNSLNLSLEGYLLIGIRYTSKAAKFHSCQTSF